MSVEGMWKFQSGSYLEPTVPRWGSILVLESGRVFGGDSVMAHLGRYEIDRSKITAKARSWVWNLDVGEIENVFGMTGSIDYEVVLEGELSGDTITGHIWPEIAPAIRFVIRMEKIAELP